MRRARTILIALAVVAVVASGCEWSFETLDGHQNGPTGQVNAQVGQQSSAVVYNNRPHVFYWDNDNDHLRHAYYNGQFWAFEILDGHRTGPNGELPGDTGSHTSAVIYNGRPHVFYIAAAGVLRHAWFNGSVWLFETLDGAGGPNGRTVANVGGETSVMIYAGRPHVFYVDNDNLDLRHAYYTGSAWGFETLDGHANGPTGQIDAQVGTFNDGLGYDWLPHVFYYDASNGDLRHGYWNGSVWVFETLDGHQNGPHGQILSDLGDETSVVLYKGRPHVFYKDHSDHDVRHGYYTGSAWSFETLDGHQNGPHGQIDNVIGNELDAVVYGGRPRAFYQDHDGNLRHGYWNGAFWAFETLDGHQNGPNGRVNSVVGYDNTALVDGAVLRVFNMQSSGVNLRHAWFG